MEKEKELLNGLVYSTSLTGLESFVTYEFQILAYTRIGNGPKSAAVRATTLSSSKLNYQINAFVLGRCLIS